MIEEERFLRELAQVCKKWDITLGRDRDGEVCAVSGDDSISLTGIEIGADGSYDAVNNWDGDIKGMVQ